MKYMLFNIDHRMLNNMYFREVEGGVEIVLAFEKEKMESFSSIFEQALRLPRSHL